MTQARIPSVGCCFMLAAMVLLVCLNAPSAQAQDLDRILDTLGKAAMRTVSCGNEGRPGYVDRNRRPSVIVTTQRGRYQLESFILISDDFDLQYALLASATATFSHRGGDRYSVSLSYPAGRSAGDLLSGILAETIGDLASKHASGFNADIYGITGTHLDGGSWCLDLGDSRIRRIEVLR